MKSPFNDPRPSLLVTLMCSSCRNDVTMTLSHYPHGPRGAHYCPVCGATGDSLHIDAEMVGGTGIEPVTPCMSSKCSTAELTAPKTYCTCPGDALDDACDSYIRYGVCISA
jgi:hypothetical protein